MAKTTHVWGIDFGQCALKALRCHREGGQVVADAFDYIEYPKILSQPEADAPALIHEALTQFLERNDLRKSKIMLSVPGQAGLSRFFKPPPVDARKIPDIVRFEARQQIPFPLDEVIWDYQRMSGGAEIDGVALDAEVGLFAMKREQVFKYIRPFLDADVEIDVVQLAPLAVFNFVTCELLKDRSEEEFDPDDPPESLVVLSMGTDSTDLVVTNGFRVWQRSIPLGGNHFTRQLTKELKLTFAKAEHVKRNARESEDPKRVFQAMRPVFNDLVTEVQRSIGFFQGLDRKAKIAGVVVVGNTVKLPGLQQYLAKNLGYDVVDFQGFKNLQGANVLEAPEFKDNVASFGVAYGLCLQGLGQGKLQTNLVPRELLTERMVRAKKPWAVAALSALLLGFSFQYFLQQSAWYQVSENRTVNGVNWKQAGDRVATLKSRSDSLKKEDDDLKKRLAWLTEVGREVASNADRRLLWLELLRAVNSGLPTTPGLQPGEIADLELFPYGQRRELFLANMETQHFTDLKEWFSDPVKRQYIKDRRAIEAMRKGEAPVADPTSEAGSADVIGEAPVAGGDPAGGDPAAQPGDSSDASDAATATPDEAPPAAASPPSAPPPPAPALSPLEAAEAAEITGPSGPGWVVQLNGFHVFNDEISTSGPAHLRATFLDFLENGQVELPIGPDPNNPEGPPLTEIFTMKELGIGYPIIAKDFQIADGVLPNPKYVGAAAMAGDSGAGFAGGAGGPGESPSVSGTGSGAGASVGAFTPGGGAPVAPGAGGGAGGGGSTMSETDLEPPVVPVRRYEFTVQFCWQENPLSKRLEQRRQEAEERQKAAAGVAASGE